MRIDLRGIGLRRASQDILRDVSISVDDGAFACVLGPSGAGKSTLLRVLAGLEVQDEGSVLLDGRPADALPPERRGIAMVFQDARLFPHMNARDNVAFPLKMRGERKAARRAQAESLLEDVQLAGLGDRRVDELSGGQRQRVALARALAASPGAVLLDEPFSGLDESLRDDMRSLVMGLHERLGTTMVMVTHDPMEALTMSDRVAYLDGGVLLQEGAPDEILLSPAGGPGGTVAASFGRVAALEGVVEAGVFMRGKLHVPAQGTGDGPAVLVRSADGGVRVLGTGAEGRLIHA